MGLPDVLIVCERLVFPTSEFLHDLDGRPEQPQDLVLGLFPLAPIPRD